LPSRTPREAVERYANPIKYTLLCVTDAILGYSGGIYPSPKDHNLSFVNSPPIGRLSGTGLSLFFSQNYSIAQSSAGEQDWKVKTEGYIYRVDDESGAEIMSYHWHPSTEYPKFPHMHLKKGSEVGRGELTRCHIPTGRMSIESVVEFLIKDFHVMPRYPDWRDVIDENRTAFEKDRTWA
jgi:hypothetical protein